MLFPWTICTKNRKNIILETQDKIKNFQQIIFIFTVTLSSPLPYIIDYVTTKLKPPCWGLYFQKCETSLKHAKLGWFFLEYFMHWWVNIEKNQYFHGQYCCWKWIYSYYITSLYLKSTEQSIWYIGWASWTCFHWWVWCCMSGLRWGMLWENFCPFLADKVVKVCGIEVSDFDRIINTIGCQHLFVVSSKNFHFRCTVVRL